MTDLGSTIAPNSQQLNADDLIAGPITITITRVSSYSAEQPIAIYFEGDGGKPFLPCKSMRRVLVHVWGREGAGYVGKRLTLFRDPSVMFGGIEVGGIRISHMSGIAEPMTLSLTATRAKRRPYTVKPLRQVALNQTAAQPNTDAAPGGAGPKSGLGSGAAGGEGANPSLSPPPLLPAAPPALGPSGTFPGDFVDHRGSRHDPARPEPLFLSSDANARELQDCAKALRPLAERAGDAATARAWFKANADALLRIASASPALNAWVREVEPPLPPAPHSSLSGGGGAHLGASGDELAPDAPLSREVRR
ncbi:MAG: hypothetical protein GC206_13245 [Alphaproteobacteria bacterium]|nr:hypothetical protein [Alphaproteobacteria bacterium]